MLSASFLPFGLDFEKSNPFQEDSTIFEVTSLPNQNPTDNSFEEFASHSPNFRI
jgi:hypothetical protein